VESEKKQEKKTASRAARANQRRMMKDVFAFGSTSLELDALAGRESHLRFDRSGIHAWGVFADQEIREGELLVEYRGEIIGNAMAEKREKEYEQAKIGSDYMFRIDGNSVCDATKQGNVARFINASCDPNRYTQIISISNTKRIVIYAKKDIQAGEELCYDYKFPLEYDEEKRIPCHCSAKDCRGFMNWDKRYVTIPLPKPNIDERRQSSSSFKSAAASEIPVTRPDSSASAS
jgi:histone-lysine N-methyltransferase SETD1